ncbi:unnamed protein product [Lupinus luteus]|uniref:Uncharacterized protein n=1 Tax=Lupinus luteus TaxID=3873 RepID=A0AAV1XDI5_LUPLU
MPVAGLKFVRKPNHYFPPTPFQCLRKVVPRFVATVQTEPFANQPCSTSLNDEEDKKPSAWKRLSSKQLGIRNSMIGMTVKKVLNGLKKRGYDVYLVGGCVRDLILKRTPIDFEIITSAELEEVMRTFSWCEIIDKNFPVCHVHMDGTIVEVSSLEFSHDIEAPTSFNKKNHLRWMSCLKQDFTINGLMFDPYARIVYDYIGGIEDIRKAKVQTIIPAATSFQEDHGQSDSIFSAAHILRAIRIAACLGFSISKETAQFVKNQSSSVLRLDKVRILMEMNNMLAYGSGEASLRLLWKFGLLDIILPFQAAYFVRQGFPRRDKRSNMLLSFFSNLDKLLAPDRPCHSSLWVGILALHKTLSDRPRDPLVVAAFSLAVHNGGNLLEAVNIARMINKPYDVTFPELLVSSGLDSESLEAEILDLAESVRGTLLQMTNEYFVSQALADYPEAPPSDLVFIPLGLYLQTCSIFDFVKVCADKKFVSKQGREIDYKSLTNGHLQEIRHVFARIVFDTVYPLHLDQDLPLKEQLELSGRVV